MTSSFKLFIVVAALCISMVQGVNVAVGKTAYQSSNWKASTTADKAIDGNDDKIYAHGSCMHTACDDKSPFWIVCLGDTYDITEITISNPDKSGGRLKNVLVEVFAMDPRQPGAVGQPCWSLTTTPGQDGVEITRSCPGPLTGKYVRVSKTTSPDWKWPGYDCDALVLCEVKVEATVHCSPGFVKVLDSCYHVSIIAAEDWYQARDACMAMDADLAVLDNMAEADALKAYLLALPPFVNNDFYIGAHSLAQGNNQYTWIDPNATPFAQYSDWAPGEPGNQFAHCVTMSQFEGFRWNDGFCRQNRAFICEKGITWPKRCCDDCPQA